MKGFLVAVIWYYVLTVHDEPFTLIDNDSVLFVSVCVCLICLLTAERHEVLLQ